MALPATDSFTGSNGTQLTDYSTKWTLNNGDFDIQSNALAPDASGTDSMAHWNDDAFNDDQYSQATVVAVQSSIWEGVCARCAASAHTGYCYSGDDSQREIAEFINGVYNSIAGYGSAGFSVNDDIRLEVEDNILTPMLNGSEDTDIGAQEDDSISSGSAGVNGYDDSTACRLDDWEGGNLAGDVYVTPAFAAAIGSSLDPAVTLGSVSVTPGFAASLAFAVDPDVILGSISVTPALAQAIASAQDPVVITGGVVVTPAIAEAIGSLIDPGVVLGSTTAAPGAAVALALALDPIVVLDSMIVIPGYAGAIGSAVDPSVIIDWISQARWVSLNLPWTFGVGGHRSA